MNSSKLTRLEIHPYFDQAEEILEAPLLEKKFVMRTADYRDDEERAEMTMISN